MSWSTVRKGLVASKGGCPPRKHQANPFSSFGDKIDAGMMNIPFGLTKEGYEMQFGVVSSHGQD